MSVSPLGNVSSMISIPSKGEDGVAYTSWGEYQSKLIEKQDKSFIGGTYLHGIFENDEWRRQWINKIRQKKGLNHLKIDEENNIDKRERLLDLLTDAFEKNINIDILIKWFK